MSDEVAQIKARVDIVDLIGSYLSLKRAGRNFVACCPFHQEKTPSFYVSPDRQSFHCFGCQKGGDVFTFVMEHENLTFREALEKLAPQAGVALDTNPNFKQDREREKKWTKLLNCAGHYFRKNFLSPQGQIARDYLKKRGFSDATIEQYKIGYAPQAWDGFIQHAKSKGFQMADLVTMGLARKKDQDRYYDFFRHRVMFPVRNAQGHLVAFGGRVLDGSEPKYMNSPETPLFNKSRTLFNFTIAKEMSKEHQHFLMMEGYTDVMMATQFNLGPAVATLGTAMTEEHMRILKRMDLPLYLVYDGDRAGQQAMERALPFILKLGIEAKAICLPSGQDPADFLLSSENWAERWQALKDASLDVFDYKMETLIKLQGIEQPEHKVSIAKAMLKDLKLNRDPIRKGVYLKSMADRLDVGLSDLEEQLNLTEKKEVVNLQFQKPSAHFKKDAPFYLLAVTLVEKYDFVTPLEELSNLPFYSSPTAKVLEKWLDAHASPGAVSHDMVMGKLTDTEKEIFSEARVAELPMEREEIKALFEEKLKAWTNDKQSLEHINGQIRQAEKEGNFEELSRLMKLKASALQK